MSTRPPTVDVHVDDLRSAIDWWCAALPARIIQVSQTGTLLTVVLRPPRRYRCTVRLISGPGALECYQPPAPVERDIPTDPWGNVLPAQPRRMERGRVI